MDAIDKLLAELKTEYIEAKTPPAQNNLTPVKLISPTIKSDVFTDNLLSKVKADILAKDAAVALQKQEELTQEKFVKKTFKLNKKQF
jgi:hypothetical protein